MSARTTLTPTKTHQTKSTGDEQTTSKYCGGISKHRTRRKLGQYCVLPSLCLLLAGWMIYYSHQHVCAAAPALCAPSWSMYLQRLRRSHYPAMTALEFEQQASSFAAPAPAVSACERCNSTFRHPCPRTIKLGLLLGQRHGGTNFVMDTLLSANTDTDTDTGTDRNTVKRIAIIGRRELLLAWEHRACSTYARYVEWSHECNVRAFVAELDRIYARFFDLDGLCPQHPHQDADADVDADAIVDEYAYYFIWKLQIDQFPPAFYSALVEYVACHRIQIVHVIREASVAAFWSIQAQTVESVAGLFDTRYTLNERWLRTVGKVRYGDVQTMALDAELARQYVLDMDANRAYLGQLIRLYARDERVIQYTQFRYEDLIGPYAHSHWDAMFAFIGVSPKGKRLTVRPREHQLPCYRKIENWKEVKLKLKGTASYDACEKHYS